MPLTLAVLGEPPQPAAQTQPSSLARPETIIARVHPGTDTRVDGFYVHVPAGAREPLTALVALHGMGADGEDFSRSLRERSDVEGWALVAPTYQYGDWRDPSQLAREAAEEMPRLASFLDRLPEITGLSVRPGVLLYGFSRGGQAANRFALAFPERVGGVAMVASGTYTLPFTSIVVGGDLVAPRFPFGVANLAEITGRTFDAERFAGIPFWMGVGERDSDPADVPHEWDPYLGDDRVERAGRFAEWLRQAGCAAHVEIFPGIGHGETEQIRAAALEFLARAARGA